MPDNITTDSILSVVITLIGGLFSAYLTKKLFDALDTNKKVIIDQTIITCKKYDSMNAYRFVNAILDKLLVVHQLNEKTDN